MSTHTPHPPTEIHGGHSPENTQEERDDHVQLEVRHPVPGKVESVGDEVEGCDGAYTELGAVCGT